MYNAQYLCVSCMEDFRNSLFSATSILLSDGEERDQRGETYSERQYNFIRKHCEGGFINASYIDVRNIHSQNPIESLSSHTFNRDTRQSRNLSQHKVYTCVCHSS